MIKKFLKVFGYFIIFILFIYGVSTIIKLKFTTVMISTMLISIFFFCNLNLIKNNKFKSLFCSLFFIKIMLLIYDIANKNLPMTSGDFQVYHMFSNDIINATNNIWEVLSFSSGTDLYVKFNALIYILLENNYNVPYLFTFIFSLILSVYLYKTAFLITKSEKASSTIVLLWMITPMEIIYSITYLKEVYIQMFFIISLYKIIEYIQKGKKTSAVLALILAIIPTLSHSGMIGVVVVYILIIAFYRYKERKLKFSIKAIIVLIVLATVILTTPLGEKMMARFKNINSTEDMIEQTKNVAGNTAYVTDTPNNNKDLLLQTPYRFLMFAIAPLPWQIISMGTTIAWVLDGLLQYFIFIFYLLYFIKYKPKNEEERVYKYLAIAIWAVTYLIFAWGTSAYGTAMRHRLKIYPMTLIFMYEYWKKIKYEFKRGKGGNKDEKAFNKYNSAYL